jgi:phosphoribosylformimino-5-aminoimidazole carboxamide ribotide isomerase
MIIIPAIDIIDGACVRLQQGDYNNKTQYAENPLNMAKSFEEAGIKHLHLVDLDGARSKKIINIEVLRNICLATGLQIDFGGGIKSEEDVRLALEAGAQQITVGSIAAKSPETVRSWINKYGPDKIILGADVWEGRIAVNGWTEKTDIDLMEYLEYYTKLGIQYCICTDISKDGMLAGSSKVLYKKVMKSFPKLKLIASGGIHNIQELRELHKMGLYGAIIGKALYEGNIKLTQLAAYVN